MARKKKENVIAAVDVASRGLVVAIAGLKGVLNFENEATGHEALLTALKKHRVERVALEPTGNYGFDLMLRLHEAGHVVLSVNPRAARQFARASGKRAKTDAVDATVLLEYATRMDVPAWVPPPPEVIELRAITRRIAQVTKAVAAEKARLKSTRATTTAPPRVIESIEHMIEYLEREAENLVKAAVAVTERNPVLAKSVSLLTSIRGVAARTAVKFLGEVSHWPDDLNIRQIVAMAGLDPRPVESGTFAGQRRISKQGNPHLRAILFMAAHNACLYEPVVKTYYETLLARGKHPKSAKVAVMRKLLHAMFGMLWSSTSFEPRLFRKDSANDLAAK